MEETNSESSKTIFSGFKKGQVTAAEQLAPGIVLFTKPGSVQVNLSNE